MDRGESRKSPRHENEDSINIKKFDIYFSSIECTLQDFKDVIYNSSYIALFSLLTFITSFIYIIMISGLNDASLLSGYGIGNLFNSLLLNSMIYGLGGGQLTICSQYFGSKQYVLMGIYLNISRIISILIFFIIYLPAAYFSYEILIYINQVPEVAVAASTYIISSIPGNLLNIIFVNTNIYLESMQIYNPGLLMLILTTITNFFCPYILMYYWEFKLIGIGITYLVNGIIKNLVLIGYLRLYNPNPESNFFYHENCLKLNYIEEYLKISIPAYLLFATDMLAFEILNLLASYLSVKDLASNIIFESITHLFFNLFIGVSQGLVTLVGNSIGGNDVGQTKRYVKCGVLLTFFLSILSSISCYLLKDNAPFIYTSDPLILNEVSNLLLFYCLFIFVDAIHYILRGVINGLGEQKYASIVSFVFYFPVNIPLSLILAFYFGWGIIGIWTALLISIFFILIFFSEHLYTLEWEKVAERLQNNHEIEDELQKPLN